MNTERKLKCACICFAALAGVVCTSVVCTSLVKANELIKVQGSTIENQKTLIAAATQKSKTQDAQYALLQDKYNLIIQPINYTPDDITVYNIPLSKDLQQYTYEECIKYGIVDNYTLVLAVMWHESNFNPIEISATNDYGIMQINKSNHQWLSQRLGISDFLDARQNITAGTYILSSLIRQYSDKNQALMVYNMGSVYAKKCWETKIYSTDYSRDILQKQNIICSNKNTKK